MTRSSVVVLLLLAAAGPATADAPPACPRLERGNLTACVLAASPRLRSGRLAVEAARGRLRTAATLLPQDPVISVSGAHRTSGLAQDGNWYVTLAQELELGGQRALRRRAAGAEVEAELHRAERVRRALLGQAWQGFFQLLALREEQALVERLHTATSVVARSAAGMAARGLLSPVDAEVAAAAALQVARLRIRTQQHQGQIRRALALLIGRPPGETVLVEGTLEPLAVDPGQSAARPELLARQAERRALVAREQLARRRRIPNLTLSGFVQRDGFGERVLGLGLSLPVPLPWPLGRDRSGEIAAAAASAARASAELDRLERDQALARADALAEYRARRQEVDLFERPALQRAEQALEKITVNVTAGRLPVREAIVAQQALIELLRSHLEVRLALCLASVRLREALALPLEVDR